MSKILRRRARLMPARASVLFLIAATAAAGVVYRTGPNLYRTASSPQNGRMGPQRTTSDRPPDVLFGVPRALLYRGHEEAMAAKETYLEGNPARLAALRALDERTESWELRHLRYPHLTWGSPTRREVLLTFDDGPDPESTPKVLDILRREKVPAVFFLVGRWVARYPDLVRREVADGHALGNHTWHHAYLTRMEPDCMRAQIRATRNAIRAVAGIDTPWFRPPGGHYDPEVVRACREMGQVIVLWSDTPGDWLRPTPQAIEARGLRYLRPGAIILLHDTLPETVAMLPDFIHRVRARGFEFAPITRFSSYVQGRPAARS
jgi:peptidoglycan/xylan/chitin deacetylase (PgdA/CDA1 family)